MRHLYLLLLLKIALPLALLCESLEVALPTRVSKTLIYVTKLHVPESAFDWRFFDELRQVLETDLNTNGFSSVLPIKTSLEESLHWPDVRNQFETRVWKKEQIPFVVAAQVFQNRFQLIVFDIAKGSSKKYPEFEISGKLDQDRTEIHRLSDAVQKDLFGKEGIASLKVIYSLRIREEDDWKSEIWVCDSDGANNRRVLAEKGYCLSPGFFPRNEDFYYISFQEGQSKIYRSSLYKTVGEPMISLRGSQVLPAINRKGDQIAFISDVAGRPDLFIQNLDGRGKMVGKARQLFSCQRATQASPSYSPDGKQIAFVSDKDGVPKVYLIEVLGPKDTKRPHPRLLTKANRENTSPAWSPDGTKIAYSAKVDGVRQIWMVDLATQTEQPITTGPENKENPSWAPDSLHLLYNTESDDSCEIYRVHVLQKEPMIISSGSHQKRFPSWSFR